MLSQASTARNGIGERPLRIYSRPQRQAQASEPDPTGNTQMHAIVIDALRAGDPPDGEGRAVRRSIVPDEPKRGQRLR
jgi:hypothetical protein